MSVSGGLFHDPSLDIIYASLAPGSTHEQVEKIIRDELERVKKEGVTEGEVAAAIAQTLASTAYHRDGSFAIAGVLNEYISAGDWTKYVTGDEEIKKVTPAEVQRVAQKYLDEDQSTTGWFLPQPTAAPPPPPNETSSPEKK